MEEKQIKQVLRIIEEEEKSYDFNDYVKNYIDIDRFKEIECEDGLKDYLDELNEDEAITGTEIIYYETAMDYLKENDPSLNESIDLAVAMDFELSSINSELLASLLKSENNLEDYNSFIEEVFNQVLDLFTSISRGL